MKKGNTTYPNAKYIVAISVFVAALGFIVYKYLEDRKKEAAVVYKLKERTGSLSKNQEWEFVRKRALYLNETIKKYPQDVRPKIALSSLFIQEARITGDYLYYDKAALKYVDDALKIDSTNFDALALKSLLQMSQHHFEQGLALAEKARTLNPYSAFIYGILVDGNVEMGNYEKAVENSDKMVSLRPDLRSYSRIAYLREIHGDYPGAIEAMKMAIEAGMPGDETTEWCRVQLGHLYEYIGDISAAEMQYKISEAERPGYPHAMGGLSRIAMHKKDYVNALRYLQQVDAPANAMQFREQMIRIYQLMGKKEKADQLAAEMIDEMASMSGKAERDESVGHYADKELAMAYLLVNDFNNALKHALMEYNRRPGNIDVNETVAWVYYNRGEYQKALPYMRTAMKTKSKNPNLLCRAALIYAHTGSRDSATLMIKEALSKNPLISDQLEKASREALTAYNINDQ